MIQIFGTKKCQGSRKAERFFRERGVPLQVIDLAVKAPSPGELRSVARAVGGIFKLFDKDGAEAKKQGLAHALLGDPDLERLLLANPRLLTTPLVRFAQDSRVVATAGGPTPEALALWTDWAQKKAAK